jgi:DNA-binding SARP family transcriptional activator
MASARTEAPARGVQLTLLDGFDLRVGGESSPLSRSCQRLVAFLALRDRPLLRPYVAGTLWMDCTEEHAAGSLRSTIWRLGQTGLDLVRTSPTHLWLAAELEIDAREAAAIGRRLLDRSAECEMSERVEGLLSLDVLPDWYEDWVTVQRERFRQLRLHALEALCERLAADGRYSEAVQAGLSAVAGEPLRESAHRALIRAHLSEGNRSEAIRQFDSCRRLLQDELSVEPSAETTRLVQALYADP